MERHVLCYWTMSELSSWLGGSLVRSGVGARTILVCAVLLAACDEDNGCPTPDCPWCTCDAQGIVEALNDDAEPSCGSLSETACLRTAQCTLEASCAAPSACRSNNCSDTCDLVTRCVPER